MAFKAVVIGWLYNSGSMPVVSRDSPVVSAPGPPPPPLSERRYREELVLKENAGREKDPPLAELLDGSPGTSRRSGNEGLSAIMLAVITGSAPLPPIPLVTEDKASRVTGDTTPIGADPP